MSLDQELQTHVERGGAVLAAAVRDRCRLANLIQNLGYFTQNFGRSCTDSLLRLTLLTIQARSESIWRCRAREYHSN